MSDATVQPHTFYCLTPSQSPDPDDASHLSMPGADPSFVARADAFAAKWLDTFFKLQVQNEQAMKLNHDTPDGEDDGEKRQHDAVGHTQDLLLAFDKEASANNLSYDTFVCLGSFANPFFHANSQRDFVTSHVAYWKAFRDQGWSSLPRKSQWVKDFARKTKELIKKDKNIEKTAGVKKRKAVAKPGSRRGGPAGSGKKKVDSDDHYA